LQGNRAAAFSSILLLQSGGDIVDPPGLARLRRDQNPHRPRLCESIGANIPAWRSSKWSRAKLAAVIAIRVTTHDC
jgi:hypothetical protein